MGAEKNAAKSPGHGRNPQATDDVGELLRLMETEPVAASPIAPERTARHKAAARAHWQEAVRARARRRRITLGLAAAAVFAVAVLAGAVFTGAVFTGAPGFGIFETIKTEPPVVADEPQSQPTSPPSGPAARVAAVHGSVRDHGRSEDAPTVLTADRAADTAFEVGSVVEVGAVLATDAASRAAFTLASGHELRLDTGTRLRLEASSIVALERGAIYVDSRGAPASLEIRTPFGTARDIGTRFEVRLDDQSLRVRVRDGRVEVASVGATHQAPAGVEITLDAQGSLAQRSVALHGAPWQWSQTVAPAFIIEGRRLSDFLDWVTHETAWQLRLDPAVAAGAATVTLSGSIDGLTLNQALSVVLPTTGLQHRVEDGVLFVEPRSNESG